MRPDPTFWLALAVIAFVAVMLTLLTVGECRGQTLMLTGTTCPNCGRPQAVPASAYARAYTTAPVGRAYSTATWSYGMPAYPGGYSRNGSVSAVYGAPAAYYGAPSGFYGAPVAPLRYATPMYRRGLFGRTWRAW